ncbi:MAG: hypothetical protein IJ927_05885 [Eubacterium sp.]|nr:hypothetical protein [Eubacterium sp.]
MTLQTLIDEAMIQGDVLIRAFDSENDCDDIVLETNDIEGEDFSEYADYEVKAYMQTLNSWLLR